MAVIEFINRSNKTFKGLRQAIKYILQQQKTRPDLIGAIDCSPEHADKEMIAVKKEFNKWDGKQFFHFVQAFHPHENVTPETVHEMAEKLLKHEKFKGFQVLFSTHVDADHLHTHFIINSVNAETGKKWHTTKEDMQNLKDFSDELCREYGLSTIEQKWNPWKHPGEYRSERRGRSWKHETYLAASQCMRRSTSKEDFIKNMGRIGYKVNWQDNHKYITFTNPDGKVCRNRGWNRLSKENLLETFQLNQDYADKQELKSGMEAILQFLRDFDEQEKGAGQLPFSHLEGQALKEKMIEERMGSHMDWEREW